MKVNGGGQVRSLVDFKARVCQMPPFDELGWLLEKPHAAGVAVGVGKVLEGRILLLASTPGLMVGCEMMISLGADGQTIGGEDWWPSSIVWLS